LFSRRIFNFNLFERTKARRNQIIKDLLFFLLILSV